MGKTASQDTLIALRSNEPLSRHTTFRIGGPAALFAEPEDLAALRAAMEEAHREGIPVRVIGNGSNILVSDTGVRALVVKLSAPFFTQISFNGDRAEVGAGALVATLLRRARERSLGGCEFLAGVPATVGGAAVMNAGAWRRQFGDLIEAAHVLDTRLRQRTLMREELSVGYRTSGLERFVVYRLTLRLQRKEASAIDEQVAANLRQRFDKQDMASSSAGCVFRNPESACAGRLIESCGLKGRRVGDAVVSEKHANFIVNSGHATAADVLKLMNLVRRAVMRSSGIALQKEIKIWK